MYIHVHQHSTCTNKQQFKYHVHDDVHVHCMSTLMYSPQNMSVIMATEQRMPLMQAVIYYKCMGISS